MGHRLASCREDGLKALPNGWGKAARLQDEAAAVWKLPCQNLPPSIHLYSSLP